MTTPGGHDLSGGNNKCQHVHTFVVYVLLSQWPQNALKAIDHISCKWPNEHVRCIAPCLCVGWQNLPSQLHGRINHTRRETARLQR